MLYCQNNTLHNRLDGAGNEHLQSYSTAKSVLSLLNDAGYVGRTKPFQLGEVGHYLGHYKPSLRRHPIYLEWYAVILATESLPTTPKTQPGMKEITAKPALCIRS